MIRLALGVFGGFAALCGLAMFAVTVDLTYLAVLGAGLAVSLPAMSYWEFGPTRSAATRRRLRRGEGMPAVVTGVEEETDNENDTALRLTVAVHGGRADPYRIDIAETVPLGERWMYTVGTKVLVVPKRPGRPHVAIVAHPDAAWRERLDAWRVPDGDPPLVRQKVPVTARHAAVFTLALLAAIAATVAVRPATTGEVVGEILTGSYNDFVFGDRRAEAVARIAEDHPRVAAIEFRTDGRVLVDVPARNSQYLDTYVYEYAGITREGPATSQGPHDLFDPRGLDLDVIGTMANRARELTGIHDPDGAQARVRIAGGVLTCQVFLAGEHVQGVITFGPTGEVTAMTGGAPGSPAARGK